MQKIAFVTDLNNEDVNVIDSLADLARPFNAELLIAHITDETFDNTEHQHTLSSFLNELTCKANYAKIVYRHIQCIDIYQAFECLNKDRQIDMLAMVDRPFNFFDELSHGGNARDIVKHSEIPLLLLPAHGFAGAK